MKSKIKSIVFCLLVNAVIAPQAQAVAVAQDSLADVNTTSLQRSEHGLTGLRVEDPTIQNNEHRLAGVVSKISDGKIVINTVTYIFSTRKAKVYDFNGQLNQGDVIKVGMFVSMLVSNDKKNPSILEIRLLKK
ncbi:MAG: hypothetical protein WCG35_03120 [Betaproteobacteria bacterium]